MKWTQKSFNGAELKNETKLLVRQKDSQNHWLFPQLISLSKTLFCLGFHASAFLFLRLTLWNFSLPPLPPYPCFFLPSQSFPRPVSRGESRPCLLKGALLTLLQCLPPGGPNYPFCTDCSQTLVARSDFSLQGQATQSLQTPQLRVSKQISHPTPTPPAPISLALLPNCPCHHSTHMKYLFSQLLCQLVANFIDVTFAASLTSVIVKIWAALRQSFHFVLDKNEKNFRRRLPVLLSWEELFYFLR